MSQSPHVSLQRARAASIALGFAMLVASGSPVYGAEAAAADEGRRRLLEDELRIVTSTQEIPAAVLAKFAELTKTGGVVLAQPGAKYQESDVVSERGLPRRRLIFAGLGPEICVLDYEMGGISHSDHVVVFAIGRSGPELVWGAVLRSQAATLPQLREAVRDRRYRDDPGYGF